VVEVAKGLWLLRGGVGFSWKAADIKGSALGSYLLFEKGYTQELMALGYADAMRQRDQICAFFRWKDPQAKSKPDSEQIKPERRQDPLRL
jgi:NTE family protein